MSEKKKEKSGGFRPQKVEKVPQAIKLAGHIGPLKIDKDGSAHIGAKIIVITAESTDVLVIHRPIGKTDLNAGSWVLSNEHDTSKLVDRRFDPQAGSQRAAAKRALTVSFVDEHAYYVMNATGDVCFEARAAENDDTVRVGQPIPRSYLFKAVRTAAKDTAQNTTDKVEKGKELDYLLSKEVETITILGKELLVSELSQFEAVFQARTNDSEDIKEILDELPPSSFRTRKGELENIDQAALPRLEGVPKERIADNLYRLFATVLSTAEPDTPAVAAVDVPDEEGAN